MFHPIGLPKPTKRLEGFFEKGNNQTFGKQGKPTILNAARFIPVPKSKSEESEWLKPETQTDKRYNIKDLDCENNFIPKPVWDMSMENYLSITVPACRDYAECLFLLYLIYKGIIFL